MNERGHLTFGEQKALLLLEIEINREILAAAEGEKDWQLELAKIEYHEREADRRIALELAKIELERKKLRLVAEGKLSAFLCRPSPPPSGPGAGLSPMVKCVQDSVVVAVRPSLPVPTVDVVIGGVGGPVS